MDRIILALRTFLALALPYFRSEDRWAGRGLLAGVVAAELGLVVVAVQIAHWQARFFNALEARNWNVFADELLIFLFIALGGVVSGVSQYVFGQTLQIRWRRWMTHNYVSLWMAQGRHYRVRFVDKTIDNIHLRIANDVYLFIQRTHELGTGLLGSIVSLASFSYILWYLSATTPLPLFGKDRSFPGYLVWMALAFAGIGTLFSHLIGWRLIPLNFNQQRYESDFRFAIVRAADHSEPIALMRGEEVERAELGRRFSNLVRNWTALVLRQARLTTFIGGYAQASQVFPILIGSPAYLVGAIPLGTLMQVSVAFQRVESALAFCIAMYSKLAEWKAIIDRLWQFEGAMAKVDSARKSGEAAISVVPSGGSDLDVEGLAVRLPEGRAIAELDRLSLAAGQRALIGGPSGSGKSSLLRALAGLWPSGEGRVAVPDGGDIVVMPQRPYFPLGTLRQAVTYPLLAREVGDGEITSALAAVGLPHLSARLDEEAEWDVVLSGGEQQRIAFARMLLRKPAVLMLDEPVSTLDAAAGQALYRTLFERLPRTILLSVDRQGILRQFHPHTIELGSPRMQAQPGLVPA